jgi:hypothetical protein
MLIANLTGGPSCPVGVLLSTTLFAMVGVVADALSD